jgi:hypothetical protein
MLLVSDGVDAELTEVVLTPARQRAIGSCHAQLRAHGLCVCDDEDIPVQVVTLKPDTFDPLKAEVDQILGNLGDRARGPLGEAVAAASPEDYFLSPKFEPDEAAEQPVVIPDGPVADAINAFLDDPSVGTIRKRPDRSEPGMAMASEVGSQQGVTANVPPDLVDTSEARTTT